MQTSVSDLPTVGPTQTQAEQTSSSAQVQEATSSFGNNLDAHGSMQSSASELNELLNEQKARKVKSRARYDALQELDQRLEVLSLRNFIIQSDTSI